MDLLECFVSLLLILSTVEEIKSNVDPIRNANGVVCAEPKLLKGFNTVAKVEVNNLVQEFCLECYQYLHSNTMYSDCIQQSLISPYLRKTKTDEEELKQYAGFCINMKWNVRKCAEKIIKLRKFGWTMCTAQEILIQAIKENQPFSLITITYSDYKQFRAVPYLNIVSCLHYYRRNSSSHSTKDGKAIFHTYTTLYETCKIQNRVGCTCFEVYKIKEIVTLRYRGDYNYLERLYRDVCLTSISKDYNWSDKQLTDIAHSKDDDHDDDIDMESDLVLLIDFLSNLGMIGSAGWDHQNWNFEILLSMSRFPAFNKNLISLAISSGINLETFNNLQDNIDVTGYNTVQCQNYILETVFRLLQNNKYSPNTQLTSGTEQNRGLSRNISLMQNDHLNCILWISKTKFSECTNKQFIKYFERIEQALFNSPVIWDETYIQILLKKAYEMQKDIKSVYNCIQTFSAATKWVTATKITSKQRRHFLSTTKLVFKMPDNYTDSLCKYGVNSDTTSSQLFLATTQTWFHYITSAQGPGGGR